jgi:hypothetical protein
VEPRWLLLIHQIPPKPDYFRVKVRRRLQRIGAHPLKNSVYVLPNSEESLEDFLWLAQEIRAGGGEATVVEATFVAGHTDEEVSAMLSAGRPVEQEAADAAEGRIEPGRTWVTRVGVKVDRMASAWLIRKFIDPEARLKFVPAKGYRAEGDELRFDMFEAEFTHEGDLCTFEVLVSRFALADPALRAIAEIVHDIDVKDAKYGREEAPGIGQLVAGIAAAHPEDEVRLARGAALFDDLYAVHGGATKH